MTRAKGTCLQRRPPTRWLAARVAARGSCALAVGLAWPAWSSAAPLVPAESGALPALSQVLLLLFLLVLLAGAALLWHTGRQLRRMSNELRGARGRLHSLDELLDVWQWQTDAEHRLLLLRPPHGAPSGDWAAAAAGELLWEYFKVEQEGALRARLASHALLDDVAVHHRSVDTAPRSFRLLGRIRTDATGRFAGYDGVLREMQAPTTAAARDPTTNVAPPVAPTTQPNATPVANAATAVLRSTAPAEPSETNHESFSFTVSHDLRAPIRVVEGFTKIVKEDYGRLLDRVGNDHLDRVLAAAARMNNMIDALLALTRLSSQPLARQPVNLSQLAAFVADDLRREAPERDVKIDIEPGMVVQGDPTLLRVVIENLMGNAWKYSAKSAQPHIVFEREAGKPDTFTVRDNGAGFDMRFADRLFGVFQRLHSANDFPGTGVGLASVRRIVRRHGGDIWGEAEVNRGARFHFSLAQEARAPAD